MSGRKCVGSWIAATTLAASIGGAHGQESTRQQVLLHVTYQHVDWVVAPPAVDDADSSDPTTTYNVLASRYVALDPQAGQPLADAPPQLECDPGDVVSVFTLDKREFLLGEPILVNYSFSLSGPGEWPWSSSAMIDGSGRESGYAFFLRHEDGTWLSDYYPQPKMFAGSILSSLGKVVQGRPESTWLAVQRWCALTKPGVYDLYCLGYRARTLAAGEDEARAAAVPEEVRADGVVYRGGLIDARTGEASNKYEAVLDGGQYLGTSESPIVGHMPAELTARLGGWAKYSSALAHFRIVVRMGTPAERRRMVESWINRAEVSGPHTWRGLPSSAAREAIWSVRQDDFLPMVGQWVRKAKNADGLYLDALALRPDTKATAILVTAPRKETLRAMSRLSAQQIPSVVPLLIDWLVDADHEVRAQSESLLCEWSGTSFKHTWVGYNWERPTLAEGRVMQPLWRAWWRKTQASGDFTPQRSRWIEFKEE
jgi:hypothetical protein